MGDANLTVDGSVMLAGLVRAVVRTCHRQVIDGVRAPDPRPELRRAATWRAARFGLEATLLDLDARRSRPAGEAVNRMLDVLRPALVDSGDWERVGALVAGVVAEGTGASGQRRAFEHRHRLEDVVDFVIAETSPGVAPER